MIRWAAIGASALPFHFRATIPMARMRGMNGGCLQRLCHEIFGSAVFATRPVRPSLFDEIAKLA
jgi:hypothetical protein